MSVLVEAVGIGFENIKLWGTQIFEILAMCTEEDSGRAARLCLKRAKYSRSSRGRLE